MARARISPSRGIKRGKSKVNKKVFILLGLNLLVSSIVLLKLFGVI